MPKNCTEAVEILEALESKLAYVPGGRDREGRPLIVVNVPPELQPTTKPGLESLITYFLSIFSEETKGAGLALIVDARQGAWRVARSCVRLCTILLGSKAATVIVVRPDGFWDKRVDSCTKSHKEGEPTYLTLTRLQLHVEFSQLPYELGGNRVYDHTEWIQRRLKVEDYRRDALDLVSRMTNLHQRLSSLNGFRLNETDDDLESYWEMGAELTATARYVLQSGRDLISSMSREAAKDSSDSVKQIHELLDSIELKQVDIESCWAEMERNLDTARIIGDLEKGVSRVTDWILGPADAMLNSCCQVGFDVSSSEELRRQHEELELECRETYGQYAELLHKIDSLPDTKVSEDLKSQRDFMDFVCRSFATRLERRRNVLITSQRFFRLVSEYFDRTSEVFDKLVMASRVPDFSQASTKLSRLERSQAALEALERELVKEGEKLSDILSMPVKDALGRDVHVDYGEDIVNVRDILDATNARKNIFNDSVELQKLSLKQISLTYTYENDAEQAVKWLNDLYDVLLKDHMEIGCNTAEIQLQKNEHQTFQETAKGTYDYGCQLVNGARVLRLSCRLPLESNANLFSRLRLAWKQLHTVGEEQLTRLRVCAVFHRSVEDHCQRLRELMGMVGALRRAAKAEDSAAESRARAEIRDILGDREKLLLEVGRMVRLGRLLRTRLKEPLCHQRMSEAEDASGKGSNLTAVEAISAKLAEVTRLAEKLDARLCEAGARTRPVPISSSTVSSNSSLFSGSTVIAAPVASPATSAIRSATAVTTPSAASTSPSTLASMSSSPSTIQLRPTFAPRSPLPASACEPAIVTTTGSVPSMESASWISHTVIPESSTLLTSAPMERPLPSQAADLASRNADDAQSSSNVNLEAPAKVEVGENGMEGAQISSCQESISVDAECYSREDADEEVIERFYEENTEDSNVDGYVTATECSTTPTARSRSESFVTSPECEDLAALATVTSTCSSATWWDLDDPKAEPSVSSSIDREEQVLSNCESERKDVTMEICKPEICVVNGLGPCERIVSIEKTVEEKSGKIVKEVTETTTLRVSHDTRLGVASYKVTSNTVQDHREHLDVKELRDLERVMSLDTSENDDHLYRVDPSTTSRVIEAQAGGTFERPQPEKPDFTRSTDLSERCEMACKEFKDEVSICVKEYTRRHEDSGIEMSPRKKEDSGEGQDFLEKARKVSAIGTSVDRDSAGCCSCNCAHEAACFDSYSSMAVHSNLIGLTTAPLVHESRTRLSPT